MSMFGYRLAVIKVVVVFRHHLVVVVAVVVSLWRQTVTVMAMLARIFQIGIA